MATFKEVAKVLARALDTVRGDETMTPSQPTEKWTLKNKTDLNSIYVWGFPSIGYKVQTVNNLLIEQLQSEAYSKGQFEALKASQIRIHLDKKLEEARADERKKCINIIKNELKESASAFTLDEETGLTHAMLLLSRKEQPVTNKEMKDENDA